MAHNKENSSNSKNFEIIRIIAIILMIVGFIIFMFGPLSVFFPNGFSIFDIIPYSFGGFFLLCFSTLLLQYTRRKKLTKKGFYSFGAPTEKKEGLENSNQQLPHLVTTPRNMVTCEVCGILNRRDAKFCDNCGETL